MQRLASRVVSVFQKVLTFYLIPEILRLYRDRTFEVAGWDTLDDSANALGSRIGAICLQYDLADPAEDKKEMKRLAMAILVHVSERPDEEFVETVVKGAFGKTG